MEQIQELRHGELVYDLAQLTPVTVVEPHAGAVGEQKDAMQDLIARSPGNRALGFDLDTPCAEITFMDLDSHNDSTYTFPKTRLRRPIVELGPLSLSPDEWVQYKLVRDVIAEAIHEENHVPPDLHERFEESSIVTDTVMDAVNEWLSTMDAWESAGSD